MQRHRIYVLQGLFLLLLLLVISSCRRTFDFNVEDDDRAIYKLSFSFTSFQSAINPFPISLVSRSVTSTNLRASTLASTSANTSVNASGELLYFWSFNARNLQPDIALVPTLVQCYTNPVEGYSFSSTGAMADADFLFPAGDALSVNGQTELYIEIPARSMLQLNYLSFNANTTTTGPQEVLLSYQFVDALSADFIALTSISAADTLIGVNTNQLMEYNLQDISWGASAVLFKLSFAEGPRNGGNEYNATAGRIRIDNFRVLGVIDPADIYPPNNLTMAVFSYFIFDAETGAIVRNVNLTLEEPLPRLDLDIELPRGRYHFHFLYNQSNASLLYGSPLTTFSEFVVGNSFDNSYAQIYGALLTDVAILSDALQTIPLHRYYSEVQILFTDNRDFSEVGEVQITKRHNYDFYAIGNAAITQPFHAVQQLSVAPYFEFTGNMLLFNQFLGLLDEPVLLSYDVAIFSRDGFLIRAFTLSEEITNNVQLLFSGRLYDTTDQEFQLSIQEEWGWLKEGSF